MNYFQFDVLRAMSRFFINEDFKNADPSLIRNQTGLQFSPSTYTPWRNYSRIFKLCLLISEIDGEARPTEIASLLSKPGVITCDEYLHFIAEATTDPSPALSEWSNHSFDRPVRNPLCFALKYLLTKTIVLGDGTADLNEIIGAYKVSQFVGSESDTQFIELLTHKDDFATRVGDSSNKRQARESLKFLAQISYLNVTNQTVVASISRDDAEEIFSSLSPIQGERSLDGNHEIIRVANYFRGGSTHDFFDYKGTILSNELENGFFEGSKVKRTHVIIERNTRLRSVFFSRNPEAVCNACKIDTARTYPWTERVLDLHHLLPLSSGTRVDSTHGTMLDDLRALCPTCHRAVHRYYDIYLQNMNRQDFESAAESKQVYEFAIQSISRIQST